MAVSDNMSFSTILWESGLANIPILQSICLRPSSNYFEFIFKFSKGKVFHLNKVNITWIFADIFQPDAKSFGEILVTDQRMMGHSGFQWIIIWPTHLPLQVLYSLLEIQIDQIKVSCLLINYYYTISSIWTSWTAIWNREVVLHAKYSQFAFEINELIIYQRYKSVTVTAW